MPLVKLKPKIDMLLKCDFDRPDLKSSETLNAF